MSDWQTLRIGDLGRVVTGKTPPSSQPEMFDGDIPFITPSDMFDDQRHISTERFVSAGWDSKQRTLLPEGAICVVCIGATIGKICMTSRSSQTNQQVNSVIVDPARFDSGFAYYALRTLADELKARAAGAATPIINKSVFSDVTLAAPALETQRRIAGILGAYDDLIGVNRRRIAVLDEMARGLFDEWFVRFRFPGYEGVAIEDTPDGPLPAGWHRAKVGGLLQKINRPIKIQKQEYIASGSVPCIDQGANFIGGYTDNQEAVIASPLPMCVFGDHTRILKFITFPFASGADGTQLLYPTGELTPVYLYLALINVDLSNQHYARHFKFLKEQMLVVPPRAIVESFSRFATPIFDAIQNHRSQSEKLAAARDLLLPRLISGQLSVTQAERELEAA